MIAVRYDRSGMALQVAASFKAGFKRFLIQSACDPRRISGCCFHRAMTAPKASGSNLARRS